MRTLVIGDAHGRHDLVRSLLARAGVVDEDGARVRDPNVSVVQVGDLINGTADTRADDTAMLRKAGAWIDVRLVGNHEYAYLGGYGFAGFERFAETDRLMANLSWVVAAAVGETLVTHAGVSALLGLRSSRAADAAVELGEAWLADPLHPFFSSCSRRRGGSDLTGGVLWKDWAETRVTGFRQLHGHTPFRDGPAFFGDPDGVWCGNLDVGARDGRVAAVWLDDSGQPTGQSLHAEDVVPA